MAGADFVLNKSLEFELIAKVLSGLMQNQESERFTH
jgi:hypothetical protein